MIISKNILTYSILGMVSIGLFCYLIVIGIKLDLVEEGYGGKKSLFLIIIGSVLLAGGLSLCCSAGNSRTDSVPLKQYEIIEASNDKSINGSGTRYKFDISSSNEFNFYYKENNAIQHKTINFDFPIYEDADSAYLEEYSYKVMESYKLFWAIKFKTYVSEEKEYKLHIPEGQFEKQDIEFN